MPDYTVTLSSEEEEVLQHELEKLVGRPVMAEASSDGEPTPLPPPMQPAEKIQSIVSKWLEHKSGVRLKHAVSSARPEEVAELERIVAEREAEAAEDGEEEDPE